MARTDLTAIDLSGAYADAFDTLTWTAADDVNKNAVTFTGGEILLIRNDDASAQDVTIVSVEDTYGRTGDLTVSVPASGYAAYGPMKVEGWRQADRKLYIDAASTSVFFCVIK